MERQRECENERGRERKCENVRGMFLHLRIRTNDDLEETPIIFISAQNVPNIFDIFRSFLATKLF